MLFVGSAEEGGQEAFWKLAASGGDLPVQIPLERWAINGVYSPDVKVDKMYTRFASFLAAGDRFDAAAFRYGCAITLKINNRSSYTFPVQEPGV